MELITFVTLSLYPEVYQIHSIAFHLILSLIVFISRNVTDVPAVRRHLVDVRFNTSEFTVLTLQYTEVQYIHSV